MIHYALRCGAAHEFDGWFASSGSFETQAASGLLSCPVCADTAVGRAMMAPRLAGAALEPPAAPAQPAVPERRAVMPDQLRAALSRLCAEVERRCDYVGPRFAAEARAMHETRVPKRPIYGEASAPEVEALREEGIAVDCIPWVKRADA